MSNLRDFLAPCRYNEETLTATAGQTVLTLSSISIPGGNTRRVLLFINGTRQNVGAYTVDSPTQITVSEALELNDKVIVTVSSF
jgi:hypothetical protein